VCDAEGHRGDRQRSFAAEEIQRLADNLRPGVLAAHGAVRELRGAPASRIHLPVMRIAGDRQRQLNKPHQGDQLI